MGSRKSTLVKLRLGKAFRKNKEIPVWKRQQPGMRDQYNYKRRDWRSSTLKIY